VTVVARGRPRRARARQAPAQRSRGLKAAHELTGSRAGGTRRLA